MKRILICGANSAIARAVARIYASEGHRLCLLGRDATKLADTQQDLLVRGAAQVTSKVCDLDLVDEHARLIEEAETELGGLDLVLVAHGVLGQQRLAESSYSATLAILNTNFLSAVSLLTLLANRFAQQGSGAIAVITSVAGERGRQSNYIYGTAKGALSIFLSGLRHRLAAQAIAVTDLRLGFVETPMTREFKKGLLWATPQQVAPAIVASLAKGADIVYIPWFWRWVMFIICGIPERIFKRLKL